MAVTDFPVNHPSAKKLWSEQLFREALKRTWMSKFIGKSSNSAIQLLTDTQKSAGDRITYSLKMQLTGSGVSGDSTLEGNEEALSTYTDNLYIDQLRHAVKSAGKMSEQRVPWNMRSEMKDSLANWWADRIDTALFNQLAGNTSQTNTVYTGSNATIAPSTNNIYYANGLANETQVASASASNAFKLRFIDYAVEKAKVMSPMIRPIKINGNDKYIMFLHPYQVTSLRTDTNTGQWADLQKAAIQGGMISNNPLYTGALGEYNNVILHESVRVPSVTTGVYRSILCGSQAATLAFGQNFGSEEDQRWVEKMFDYDNQLGISAAMIWGAKKTRFNSQDFGTIVVSTYAQAAF